MEQWESALNRLAARASCVTAAQTIHERCDCHECTQARYKMSVTYQLESVLNPIAATAICATAAQTIPDSPADHEEPCKPAAQATR
jgi:hypothetical protein